MTTEVRCPMPECRRRVDLDALPPFPEQPAEPPCLHYITEWGDAAHGRMAEAVLFALTGDREFVIRNVRPAEIPQDWIDPVRGELEATAREFAHEVAPRAADAGGDGGGDAGEGRRGRAALFGDLHERHHVARRFATLLLGPDPMAPRFSHAPRTRRRAAGAPPSDPGRSATDGRDRVGTPRALRSPGATQSNSGPSRNAARVPLAE